MKEYNKILIVGATSFAATYLIQSSLSIGLAVIGVSRSPEYDDIFLPYAKMRTRRHFQFHQIDIRKNTEALIELISKEKPDLIVDFAGQGMVAQSWQSPEQWYDTNLVSKSRLVNYLNNCDFLNAYIKVATPEVYGSVSGTINESRHFNPTTPYAISHAAIDMHLNAYFKQYAFPVMIARFANFYGPHQQLYRLAPQIFYAALSDNTFNLDGKGTSIRAFIHGTDVADAIFKTAAYGKLGDTYHFTTDEFVTIREFVNAALTICRRNFKDIVRIRDDRPGKDLAYLMDSKKAKSDLKWYPKVSLNQGLISTYQWIKENLELIRNYPVNYIHKR